MSTIKSSAENLTLNADGANNDIIFQSNGTTKATLDQAGLLTATSFAGNGANLTNIPATDISGKLNLSGGALTGAITTNSTFDGRDVAADGVLATNALPKAGGAMSGTITNFRSTGIDDNSNALAMTINSSEKVGIGIADAHHMLHIKKNSTANSLASGVLVQLTNEQGAGYFSSLRFTGSNQNGYIGYRDGANDQDRRVSIGIGADAEHFSFSQEGLKFNGDTAAANGLDDYEEGTFTATLTANSSAPNTAVTATGQYTKIGRLVTVQIIFDNKNTTGASGYAKVTGLPYTGGSKESFGNFISYNAINYVNSTTSVGHAALLFVASGTAIHFYDMTDSGPWQRSHLTAGSGKYVYLSGTYST